jgi:hypothetical protein
MNKKQFIIILSITNIITLILLLFTYLKLLDIIELFNLAADTLNNCTEVLSFYTGDVFEKVSKF